MYLRRRRDEQPPGCKRHKKMPHRLQRQYRASSANHFVTVRTAVPDLDTSGFNSPTEINRHRGDTTKELVQAVGEGARGWGVGRVQRWRLHCEHVVWCSGGGEGHIYAIWHMVCCGAPSPFSPGAELRQHMPPTAHMPHAVSQQRVTFPPIHPSICTSACRPPWHCK